VLVFWTGCDCSCCCITPYRSGPAGVSWLVGVIAYANLFWVLNNFVEDLLWGCVYLTCVLYAVHVNGYIRKVRLMILFVFGVCRIFVFFFHDIYHPCCQTKCKK